MNPTRVACKASLRPGGLPWHRLLVADSRAALDCGLRLGGRIRTCVVSVPGRVDNPYPTPRCWVTARFRSGTCAFTARHAEPLHYGHHRFRDADSNRNDAASETARLRQRIPDRFVRPSRIELASPGYRPRALPLSYRRVRGAGIEPASPGCRPGAQPLDQPRSPGRGSRTRNLLFPKQAAYQQAITRMMCAPSRNRTAPSGSSNRRSSP